MYIYIHLYICVCVYVHMHVHLCILVYMHMHIYLSTYLLQLEQALHTVQSEVQTRTEQVTIRESRLRVAASGTVGVQLRVAASGTVGVQLRVAVDVRVCGADAHGASNHPQTLFGTLR